MENSSLRRVQTLQAHLLAQESSSTDIEVSLHGDGSVASVLTPLQVDATAASLEVSTLEKERQKASFSVADLTCLLYGGRDNVEVRTPSILL